MLFYISSTTDHRAHTWKDATFKIYYEYGLIKNELCAQDMNGKKTYDKLKPVATLTAHSSANEWNNLNVKDI